jgi:hypothetical protein
VTETHPADAPRGAAVVLRSARWIHGSLIAGLVTGAAAVAALVGAPGSTIPPPEEPLPELFPIVAGALTILVALPAMALGGLVLRRLVGAPGLPPEQRSTRYLTAKLTIASMIESAGLLWLIVAFLSRDPIHLAGVAFSIVALGFTFPSAGELARAMGEPRD